MKPSSALINYLLNKFKNDLKNNEIEAARIKKEAATLKSDIKKLEALL